MLINGQINSPAYHGDGSVVYESVRRFALKGLSDLIRVLMENIDDALFELSEKSETDRQHNIYFEAMREIRRKSSLFRWNSVRPWRTALTSFVKTRQWMTWTKISRN
ncbi:hypothetical protein MnTg03_00016 [bacterium MnTg03]|nr:hypothetical protein MnTg03_00016 [bacterium MnTg03]